MILSNLLILSSYYRSPPSHKKSKSSITQLQLKQQEEVISHITPNTTKEVAREHIRHDDMAETMEGRRQAATAHKEMGHGGKCLWKKWLEICEGVLSLPLS
jgi:hypothetical protein